MLVVLFTLLYNISIKKLSIYNNIFIGARQVVIGERMKNYKRSFQNLGKGLRATTMTMAGFGMIAFPYTAPLGVVAVAKGTNDLVNSMYGNYIKNSMMRLQNNRVLNKIGNYPSHYIVQGLPSPKQFLEATMTKNKMDFLKLQEMNLLLQLDQRDENGNQIEYHASTHSGNYMLLKQLEKKGVIEQLKKTPTKKSSLKTAKLLMGNRLGPEEKQKEKEYEEKRKAHIKQSWKEQKGIWNKYKVLSEEMKIGIHKKTQMYDISFQKTEKIVREQDMINMLPFITENGIIDTTKFNVKTDQEGTIKGIDYTKKYILQHYIERARQRISQKEVGMKEHLKTLTNHVVEKEVLDKEDSISQKEIRQEQDEREC